MENGFSGYYRPSNELLSQIWNDCIFILDTNVLLGLYRYPKDAHDELIKTFKQISDRLWIPHQVALEYQENRLSEISDQLGKFNDLSKILNETQTNLKTKITDLQLAKRHSVINPENFLSKIADVFREFQAELDRLKEEQPDISDIDLIRLEIDSLLEDKIGVPLTSDELENLYNEGKNRYKQLRPPGFSDIDKTKQEEQNHFWGDLVIKREFGDLIIWFQIIKEAINIKANHIIFITDDNKEDWWWKYKGKTIGARPELVQEIQEKAGISNFYMYNSPRFLKYAKEFLGAEIDQKTINQVKEISQLQKEMPNRISTIQHRSYHIEQFIYSWLQFRFDGFDIKVGAGFPDFEMTKSNNKIGYEVKYVRDPRYILSKWRNSLYHGFYEVSKGNFSSFYFAFVIDHNKNFDTHRWVKNLEIPDNVRIHIFEAYIDSNEEIVDLSFIKEFPE